MDFMDGGHGHSRSHASDEEVIARSSALRLGLALLLFFGLAAILGALLKDEFAPVGRWITEQLGPIGMGVGTFLADGLHFPVPPQFYMLAAISTGVSPVLPLIGISIGSLVGGWVAYSLAGWFARVRFFRKLLDEWSPTVQAFMEKHGTWAAVLGSLSPIPFSTLCNLIGLYRVPRSIFYIILGLRVPRLILFYLALRAGWHSWT